MKKFISPIILLLILSITVFSQSVDDKIELVDEFGNVQMGDYLARLDAFVANIQNSNDKTIGLIRVYGSYPEKDYAYPFQRIISYVDYVIGFRGLNTKVLKFQNCDLNTKSVSTRFFLIPKDSETPKCNEDIIVPQKTKRFSIRNYENPHYYFDNPYPEFDGAFPTIENEVLNKLLKKSPDGKIVLIGYLGSNVYNDYKSKPNGDNEYPETRKPDAPQSIHQMLEEHTNSLIKSGISVSNISVINGGYVDSTRRVEIWFVPKDGVIPTPKPNYIPKQLPMLFDDFGKINLDDLMGRLDATMIHTQNNPDSKALFRIYGNSFELGNNPIARAELYEAYWINTRKFPIDNLIIEQCFSEKKVRTQIFILLEGEKLDDCKKKIITPKKTILFDLVYFYLDSNELIPLRKSYIALGHSEGEYSEDTLKLVKNFLSESSKHKTYIIAYGGTNLYTIADSKKAEPNEEEVRKIDKKSRVRKRIKNAKKEMLKMGIKASQIKTINGGYVDQYGRIEFWFVPKGGEIPKPKPNYFPNKKK